MKPPNEELIKVSRVRPIRVEGVPNDHLPLQVSDYGRGGNTVTLHHFPADEQINYYLLAMDHLITRFRGDASALSPNQVIDTLADYLYLATHAHPFYRVNHSLFMTQVNFLLNRAGLNGIPHGHLDYYALVDRERFLEAFRWSVRRANPGLEL